jgi:endonuclease/exonuclease/phosphatase family metal-dependent hydrolase
MPLSMPLVFIGTHLKSKKQFAAHRTAQTQALLQHVNVQYPNDRHVILAGDFNGESSEPFYDLLIQAKFHSTYRDLMNGAEPSFTSWRFKARNGSAEKEESTTIDYIFYRSNRLKPISYLEIPIKADIGCNGLPSKTYPSDHLALQTIFLISKN